MAVAAVDHESRRQARPASPSSTSSPSTSLWSTPSRRCYEASIHAAATLPGRPCGQRHRVRGEEDAGGRVATGSQHPGGREERRTTQAPVQSASSAVSRSHPICIVRPSPSLLLPPNTRTHLCRCRRRRPRWRLSRFQSVASGSARRRVRPYPDGAHMQMDITGLELWNKVEAVLIWPGSNRLVN
ncbi:unnamed protein product [Urochloa humidicola]